MGLSDGRIISFHATHHGFTKENVIHANKHAINDMVYAGGKLVFGTDKGDIVGMDSTGECDILSKGPISG